MLPCAVRYERWIGVHQYLHIRSYEFVVARTCVKTLTSINRWEIGNPVMKASKLILRKCGEAEIGEVDTLLCTNHASFVLGMNPLYNTTSEWAGIMLWLEPHQRPSVPGGCGWGFEVWKLVSAYFGGGRGEMMQVLEFNFVNVFISCGIRIRF